jgi:hypothetical protein
MNHQWFNLFWRPFMQQQQEQEQPKKLNKQFSEQQEKQQRRYYHCNKGCGQEIYFDANNKSQSGKWIPIDKETGSWCSLT